MTPLLEALENGKVLCRRYAEHEDETVQMEWTQTGYRRYIRDGWCSRVGSIDDLLNEIYVTPELWEIVT